jgi:FAD dependent monooxygenase
MFAEYACVYGISSAVPELMVGEQVIRFYDGLTIIAFPGKGGRVFWFVLQKMDQKYIYPNVPRFTKLDAERVCQGLETSTVWREVTFGHVWASREVYSMTASEENVFPHWNFGRIVCLGDSMHKVSEIPSLHSLSRS